MEALTTREEIRSLLPLRPLWRQEILQMVRERLGWHAILLAGTTANCFKKPFSKLNWNHWQYCFAIVFDRVPEIAEPEFAEQRAIVCNLIYEWTAIERIYFESYTIVYQCDRQSDGRWIMESMQVLQ